MRKLLPWAGGLLLVAQMSAAGAQDNTVLARGKYLVEGIVACGNCHVARDDKGRPLFDQGLSGGMVFDPPGFKARAPNITPDPETGIGRWTDAQLAKAIREGIRPDGSLIGPPMPIEFYRRLSDADLAAIIAYVRAQPAVKRAVEKSAYDIPLPPSYGPPVNGVRTPEPGSMQQYGRYLADIAHCMDCHTPRDDKGQLVLSRVGAGGRVFNGPWGNSVSRNLTPDKSGLKDWSDAQIIRAIREGVDRNGVPYKPPMAFGWYRNVSDADMRALIAYLRALPPQSFAGNN